VQQVRFGLSQNLPAGPQGTSPDAAGLIGVVLGAPASPRSRPAAPLPVLPGFCSVALGLPSFAEGWFGSVTVLVSPLALPGLPVLEGVSTASGFVAVESLALLQPAIAQFNANGSATSTVPGHQRDRRGKDSQG